jgi:hypothetical protein
MTSSRCIDRSKCSRHSQQSRNSFAHVESRTGSQQPTQVVRSIHSTANSDALVLRLRSDQRPLINPHQSTSVLWTAVGCIQRRMRMFRSSCNVIRLSINLATRACERWSLSHTEIHKLLSGNIFVHNICPSE